MKQPFDMMMLILFIWNLYDINLKVDEKLIESGSKGQITYKIAGFCFLILHLEPHLIDFS